MLEQLFPNERCIFFPFLCLYARVTDGYWIYCKLQKWIWKNDEKEAKGGGVYIEVCVYALF